LKFRVAILLCVGSLCKSVLADTVILAALPAEQTCLSRQIRTGVHSVDVAEHRLTVGYHKGEKIYIVRTGAGNLNSAMVTQALLTRYKIDRVVSIGVAGNLNDDWKIGDIFIATDVANHQEGTETPGGFQPKENVEERRQKPEEFQEKCEALRSNAVEIARTLTGGILAARTNGTTEPLRQAQGDNMGKPQAPPGNVRIGKLVSGDSFIASTVKRKWLRDTFHADAVDMVSAGIARACEANGVPYVIIRILSDNADESAAAAFTKFVQSGKDAEPVTVPIALRLIEQVAPPRP
jgi:adenosylhomocysteine nucleosidase